MMRNRHVSRCSDTFAADPSTASKKDLRASRSLSRGILGASSRTCAKSGSSSVVSSSSRRRPSSVVTKSCPSSRSTSKMRKPSYDLSDPAKLLQQLSEPKAPDSPKRAPQNAPEPRKEPVDDEPESMGEDGEGDERPRKHIHPCICDIDKRRMAAIRTHLKKKQIAQHKFEARLRQIEEEFRLAEEAELERRRQMDEEQELYGDEYEQQAGQRVRKKRSARRASMVSLGVKQIINWKKSPKLKVKYNRTSELRKENPTYCRKPLPESLIVPVKWNEEPKISIRTTKTVTLRNLEIKKRIAVFEKERSVIKYPKRPPFTFFTYVY